jgi:hypothetical protein
MTRITSGSAGILPACFFGLKPAGRMPALPVSAVPSAFSLQNSAFLVTGYGHNCTWKNSAGADPPVSALVAVYVKTPLA